MATEDFAFRKFQEGGEAYNETLEKVGTQLEEEIGGFSDSDDTDYATNDDYDDDDDDDDVHGGMVRTIRQKRRRAHRQARIEEVSVSESS